MQAGRSPELEGVKKMRDGDGMADVPACNCLSLRQATRQISQLYDRHLAVCGLRGTQYSLLSRIGRLGPVSIQDLAASLAMDRTTLGRNMLPLQRQGLVGVAAGEDARRRELVLTPAGRVLLARAREHWRAAQVEFETVFGKAPAADLRELCARVVEAVAPVLEDDTQG
jgi:DNA-binding MarR family transcriptional regulator